MAERTSRKLSPMLIAYLEGDDLLSRLYAEQAIEQSPPELDQSVLAATNKAPSKKATKPASKEAETPPKKQRPNANKKVATADKPNWIKILVIVAAVVIALALILDLLQDQTVVREVDVPLSEAPQTDLGNTDTAITRAQSPGSPDPTTPTSAADKPEAIAPGSASADNITDDESVIPEQPPATAAPAPKQQSAPPEPTPDTDTQPSQSPSLGPPPEPGASRARQNAPPPGQAPQQEQQRSLEPGTSRQQNNPFLSDTPPQTTAGQAPEYRESPQSWIRHIVFLADTGDTAKAASELRAFRQENPNAAIPAELQALAPR